MYILLVVFYLFPVDNCNFRVGGEYAGGVGSGLTVKTSKRRQLKSFWCFYCCLCLYFVPCSGVYVFRFWVGKCRMG